MAKVNPGAKRRDNNERSCHNEGQWNCYQSVMMPVM